MGTIRELRPRSFLVYTTTRSINPFLEITQLNSIGKLCILYPEPCSWAPYVRFPFVSSSSPSENLENRPRRKTRRSKRVR